MAFLQQFRDKIGRYYCNKETAINRYPRVMNFHNSKSIAFLYQSQSESSVIMMKQYMKEIKAAYGTPKMMAFAFVNSKEVPSYHKHKLEYDFCSSKDLNWFGKPKSDSVKNFVNEDFDILLDLSDGECIPLNFVLKQSRAKFKVGKYSEERNEVFDMNIDVKKNASLEDFMKQVNWFLNRINKGA